VPSPTRSASQNQEQDDYLQSFPAEIQSSNSPTRPPRIALGKATEVALLAFSSEQSTSSPVQAIESSFTAARTAPSPLSIAPHRGGAGTRFAGVRWVLAVIVCVLTVAGVAMFAPARAPAKSLPPVAEPVAANPGAATSTSNQPTAAPPAPAAAEPVAALIPPPAAPPTVAITRPEAVRRQRVTSNVPLGRPTPSPPVPTYSGSLAVSSSPEGARVFVNGVPVGATPLLLADLAAGSRAVRLELPGHDRWSSAVRIIASEETRLAVTLRPSPSR
jgi:hypothetical protein